MSGGQNDRPPILTHSTLASNKDGIELLMMTETVDSASAPMPYPPYLLLRPPFRPDGSFPQGAALLSRAYESVLAPSAAETCSQG